MAKDWKAFFKVKEPTENEKGGPLTDLAELWIFLRPHSGPGIPPGALRAIRRLKASSLSGGGEHLVEFEGLVGPFEVEVIAVDRWGMQSKKEWLVLSFGDHPPGKPKISETGSAWPYL